MIPRITIRPPKQILLPIHHSSTPNNTSKANSRPRHSSSNNSNSNSNSNSSKTT